MPKSETLLDLYPHPFSAAYWRAAAEEVRNVRKLTFAALMIAMCCILGLIPSIQLPGGARVSWGFLARASCAWVCGPVLGTVFAVAEDTLSFIISGGGGTPYFPGYTLTTVLGVLTYALFFYRARPTVGRVFAAKALTNIQNVLLGTLWTSILSGKAWLVLAPARAIKNVIMFPVQAAMLLLLLKAIAPALAELKLIPQAAAERRTRMRSAL